MRMLLAKSVIQGCLRRIGYRLVAADAGGTMAAGLRWVAAHRQVATVVDVGASNGQWALVARRYLPDARYLLVEAQGWHHERALAALARRFPEVEFAIAAAADQRGTIRFERSDDPYGGVASRTDGVEVAATTIDHEVEARGLKGPYLLKLDTHGFEVPILEGAARTLEQTDVLIVEAYNFRLTPECLLFHDLVAYLEARGFRCARLADVLHRPSDGMLWQFDLFFVRADSREVGSNEYEG